MDAEVPGDTSQVGTANGIDRDWPARLSGSIARHAAHDYRHGDRDGGETKVALLRLCWTSLILLLAGVAAAGAQPVPTKTITFYNNSSDHTLYPVIQAPIQNGANVRDLWLQAQFQVGDVTRQIFNTTLLYRIFVNRAGGVPPNSSVTLTLPFYTQLLPTTPANLGRVDDQFIDWWNAMRVFVFLVKLAHLSDAAGR